MIPSMVPRMVSPSLVMTYPFWGFTCAVSCMGIVANDSRKKKITFFMSVYIDSIANVKNYEFMLNATYQTPRHRDTSIFCFVSSCLMVLVFSDKFCILSP